MDKKRKRVTMDSQSICCSQHCWLKVNKYIFFKKQVSVPVIFHPMPQLWKNKAAKSPIALEWEENNFCPGYALKWLALEKFTSKVNIAKSIWLPHFSGAYQFPKLLQIFLKRNKEKKKKKRRGKLQNISDLMVLTTYKANLSMRLSYSSTYFTGCQRK